MAPKTVARKKARRGLFITFEGPEGCGKSTHAKLLFEYLSRSGECVYTREPGGTKAGELIRGILLHAGEARIANLTETLLFEASRSQIVDEVIAPALAAGKTVICDRYSDSTVCYQGYAGGIPVRSIRAIDRIATGGLKPDLTVLLDIDTVTGLTRARKKGIDRMEAKALAYHRRVRAGFLALAAKEPRRIRVVRVTGSVGRTQARIRERIADVISRRERAG